jgi:hypothetical protein
LGNSFEIESEQKLEAKSIGSNNNAASLDFATSFSTLIFETDRVGI